MQRLRSQFDPEVSHQLERLAARAWPADEVEEVEGWLLRRTIGVDRRRSNSLLPPADPAAAVRTVDLALVTAEALDFPLTIQVAPAEGHLRLVAELEERGMALSGASLMLAGPMRAPTPTPVVADITIQLGEGPPDPGPVASPPAVAVQLGDLTDVWVDSWAAIGRIDGTRETAELVLSQLGARARFALAVDVSSSRSLGVGFGVVEEGWLGLFSLVVLPEARRSGIASAIVDALEAWASGDGATRVLAGRGRQRRSPRLLRAARLLHRPLLSLPIWLSASTSPSLQRAAGRLMAARSLCSCSPAPLPPSRARMLLRNYRTLELMLRRCGRDATGVVQECAREGTPPGRPAREGARSGRR